MYLAQVCGGRTDVQAGAVLDCWASVAVTLNAVAGDEGYGGEGGFGEGVGWGEGDGEDGHGGRMLLRWNWIVVVEMESGVSRYHIETLC